MVTVVITVVVAVVIVIVVALVLVVVPFMIMLDPSTVPFPVPLIELSAFISGNHPASSAIRRARVVPVMPLPMISDGVPIT